MEHFFPGLFFMIVLLAFFTACSDEYSNRQDTIFEIKFIIRILQLLSGTAVLLTIIAISKQF